MAERSTGHGILPRGCLSTRRRRARLRRACRGGRGGGGLTGDARRAAAVELVAPLKAARGGDRAAAAAPCWSAGSRRAGGGGGVRIRGPCLRGARCSPRNAGNVSVLGVEVSPRPCQQAPRVRVGPRATCMVPFRHGLCARGSMPLCRGRSASRGGGLSRVQQHFFSVGTEGRCSKSPWLEPGGRRGNCLLVQLQLQHQGPPLLGLERLHELLVLRPCVSQPPAASCR